MISFIDTDTHERIRMLPLWQERINLAWPFVLALCAAVSVLLGVNLSLGHRSEWILFLSGTLFLNITHNALTIFMIITLPEIRSWMNGKTKDKPILLMLKWALIFCALLVFFYHALTGLKEGIVYLIFIGVCPCLAFHHLIRQYSGLSIVYHQEMLRRLDFSEVEKRKIHSCAYLEKLGFQALIFLQCSIIFLSKPAKIDSTARLFATIVAVSAYGVASGILLNSFRFPQWRRSNKSIYLGRAFLVPLSFVAPFAIYSLTSFVHGVEYSFFVLKTCRNSSARFDRSAWLLLLLLCGVVVLLYLPNPVKGLRWILQPRFFEYSRTMNWMAALSLALTFFHYYLDREIFRMNDPLNRKFIAPIMIGNRAESAANRAALS